MDGTEDAIVAYSAAGKILTWNHGAEAILGYSAGEAIGKNVSAMVPPERRQALSDLTRQVLSGTAVSQYEGLCLRKDGRRIDVSVTGCPLRDSAGEVAAVSTILRDTSGRRKAEQAQALLASIVECSEAAIHSVARDGTIVSWNRGAELLFGYSSGEMVGKSAGTLAPPSHLAEFYECIRAVQGGSSIGSLETAVSPIRNSAGEVVGASAIASDMSKRLSAERKLRESEERFREVFENAPFGLAVTGTDRRFLQVNAALCRMLGYSEQELHALNWADLTHPDDLAASQKSGEQLSKDPQGCVGRVGTCGSIRHRNRSLPDGLRWASWKLRAGAGADASLAASPWGGVRAYPWTGSSGMCGPTPPVVADPL